MEKILIFSTAYLPFIGGAEVAVKEITDRIGDFEFDLICARIDRKLPKFERIGRVNVYRVGLGLKKLDKYLLAWRGHSFAQKLHRQKNYDAVWAIMASYGGIAAALFKIFNNKISLILTLQEGDEEEHLGRYVFNIKFLYKILIRPWHRLVFKKADMVTAISNHLKKRAIRNGVKGEVLVVPNGVDIERFKMADLGFKMADFKNRLGIREDDKLVITVSRLVKKNGIDDLIRAMALVAENSLQEVKLLICGSGQDELKLKKLARDLKIENKVMFLGRLDHNQLPRYLWVSDVFCRPSLSEGLGNVFLEAMAAGLPVIATPVGGIPDYLIDGQTGWYCQARDPKSIAEKITYVLDEKNSHEIKQVVGQARQLVAEQYDWQKIVEKMKAIFSTFSNRHEKNLS